MKQDLFTVDPDLEEALEAVRRRAGRLQRGRIFLELHKFGGCVVEWRVRENVMTEAEIEQLMRERPRKPKDAEVVG